MRKLLIMAYERFGDNLCSAGAISQIKDAEIYVCTSHIFGDSVHNIPNVKEVLVMEQEEATQHALKHDMELIQLTLSRMPSYVERLDERCCYQLKKHNIDYIIPKTAFFPTNSETEWANDYVKKFTKPLLGFEGNFTSSQSYLSKKHIDRLIEKFKKKYDIIWLCNGNIPTDKTLVDIPMTNRRLMCCLLPKLSLFVSTFSGYYWASKAFGESNVPKTLCFLSDHLISWADKTNTTFILAREFEEWFANYNV